MSVLIKGMEMPKSCDECWALDDYGDYPKCRITEEQRGYNFPITEKRMEKCLLVPVPEHGRLIDADALEELFKEVIGNIQEFKAFAKRPEIWEYFEHMALASAMAVQMIQNAPTIIPAEPPKEGMKCE